jgi:hypothetical protein
MSKGNAVVTGLIAVAVIVIIVIIIVTGNKKNKMADEVVMPEAPVAEMPAEAPATDAAAEMPAEAPAADAQ